MEMLKRKIRLFFVNYGKPLFYIIGIIVIFILSLNGLKSYVARKSQKTVQEKTVKQEINKTKRIDIEKENKNKGYILAFVNRCMNGEIQEAYNLLSDESKQKYKTVNEFKTKYVDVLYNTKIVEYKIENENDVYTIYLTEDMLITGRTQPTKQTKIELNNKRINIYY